MKNINKDEFIEKMTNYLPTFRVKLGLTQEELGEIVGVSKYTILGMERHQRKMSWGTFLSLILVFQKNDDTNAMLDLFQIYTDELNEYLSFQKNDASPAKEPVIL